MSDVLPPAAESASSSSLQSDSGGNEDVVAGLLPTQYLATEIADQRRDVFRSQMVKLLDHLTRYLDIAYYCEITVLYYMDCSALRFLIRAIPHWFCFTPKPENAPPIPSDQRPFFSTIFGTNILCALLHACLTPPSGGEAVRGYLHGGLMIDFVGQHPVSRWSLLGLDLLCLVLQTLLLAVTVHEQKYLIPMDARTAPSGGRQNHDTEEASVRRASPYMLDAIEMQDFRRPSNSSTTVLEEGEEWESLEQARQSNVLDVFYAGNCTIADLHLLDILQMQWKRRTVSTGPTATSGIHEAAAAAGRRLTGTVSGSRALGEG